MTNWEQYCRAALPDPVTVLGLRLRPFCVGHAILLQRLGNPFWASGQATADHLVVAAMICSGTYEDGMALLTEGPGFLMRCRLAGVRALLRVSPERFQVRASLLASYVRDSTSAGPDLWEEDTEDPRRSTGMQPLVSTYLAMMRCGLTSSEALNLPLGQALWTVAADACARGRARFVSDRDREMAEIAAKIGLPKLPTKEPTS
jgi:hypothetical protein